MTHSVTIQANSTANCNHNPLTTANNPPKQLARKQNLLLSGLALGLLALVCLSALVECGEYKEKGKKIHIVHVPKPVFIKKPVYIHVEKKVPVYKIKPVFVPKPIIVKKIEKVPVIKKVHIIQKVKVPVIKKVPYPVPVKKIKVSGSE